MLSRPPDCHKPYGEIEKVDKGENRHGICLLFRAVSGAKMRIFTESWGGVQVHSGNRLHGFAMSERTKKEKMRVWQCGHCFYAFYGSLPRIAFRGFS